MRVACRQLGSGLRVFATLVDDSWARSLRTELSWIAGELGAARDLEVLEARLLRDLVGLPLSAHDAAAAETVIRRALDADALAAQPRAMEAMMTDRYLGLLDSLVDAAAAPRLTPAAEERCSDALPPLVLRAWHRLERDVQRLRKKGADEPWHAARIRGKHTRYAVEALTPVFGAPARAWAKQLALVTELLGSHQDAAIAADAARSLATSEGADGTAGFVFGLLYDADRAHVAAARRQFVDLWPAVARQRWRRWLPER